MAKILVVDDDESILDAVMLTLEDGGFTVETSPKGEETYQKVKDFQPQLILLDVLMSGVDGREICKNLKANPATKNIPIIMISAHPTAAKESLSYGADAFLAKPFETDDLLKTVARFVSD